MGNNVPVGQASVIYAKQFYDLMYERAELRDLGDGSKPVMVYEGKLTELFLNMKVSDIYYSKVRRILMEYDCITYVQRGTKSYDSILVLHKPPPEEIAPALLTSTPTPATLDEIGQRLTRLEDWRETTSGGINIAEALRNMEGRLAKLERGKMNGKTKT